MNGEPTLLRAPPGILLNDIITKTGPIIINEAGDFHFSGQPNSGNMDGEWAHSNSPNCDPIDASIIPQSGGIG